MAFNNKIQYMLYVLKRRRRRAI